MDPMTIAGLVFAGIKLAESLAASGRRIERPEDITPAEIEAIKIAAAVSVGAWDERVAQARHNEDDTQ